MTAQSRARLARDNRLLSSKRASTASTHGPAHGSGGWIPSSAKGNAGVSYDSNSVRNERDPARLGRRPGGNRDRRVLALPARGAPERRAREGCSEGPGGGRRRPAPCLTSTSRAPAASGPALCPRDRERALLHRSLSRWFTRSVHLIEALLGGRMGRHR